MNETNAPVISKFLDEAVRWNDKMQALPSAVLMIVACLALGYALKAMAFFSNRWIPSAVIAFGVVGNVTLSISSMPTDMRMLIPAIMRGMILGMLSGCVAWFLHNKWLSKYEDQPPKPPESPKP